ncbi:MAG: hypothetical protein U9Q74_00390 [Gemmatimonadota bacterium]|nr:hypothetical protein [Gemmatimonadota bacterium]
MPVVHLGLRRSGTALAVLACLGATPPAAGAQAAEKLGTISFPTSGSAAAQPAFVRGMLLYYSFEYERAATAFREAQAADSAFAMAYWGEALTHTHQVWNQQDLAAARAALAKLAPTATARRAKVNTPRERAYFDLAEALYGEGSKARRDTLFTAAAARLQRAYPGDDEPKVLHALGLLGLNQGDRDVPSYMQAGALAEEVLRHNPDHPGAAHFVIHAFDDPAHAPLGLWAARRYSAIAPGAPHAQHMTSHIFLAVGLWDDVIAANIRAAASQQRDLARAGQPLRKCGHYNEWLHYGLLQAGRYREARAALDACAGNQNPDANVDNVEGYAGFRAAQIVDAGPDGAIRITDDAPRGTPGARAYMAFGTGYANWLAGSADGVTRAREGAEAALRRQGAGPIPTSASSCSSSARWSGSPRATSTAASRSRAKRPASTTRCPCRSGRRSR